MSTETICQHLLDEVKTTLPEKDTIEAQDYLNHGEWGLFIDTILATLAEENIPVSKDSKRHIEALEKAFDMNMAHFKKDGSRYIVITAATHLTE